MSLYEIATMMTALLKRRKPETRHVSDEEWQEAKAMLKAGTEHDASVRL